MPRKILFVFLLGALLVSACAPKTVEPVDAPGVEAEASGEILPEVVREPEPEWTEDQMPCSTVYGYQTTAETDYYQAIIDQLPPLREDDWVKGNPDAPITIFEYADFQCPACVNFAQFSGSLYEYFPNSIKIVFRHLPLPSIHGLAFISGMAAEAAGAQGKFWEMHDLLYLSQGQWNQLTEEMFVNWIVDQAQLFELDVDQFRQDLLNEEKRAWLEETTTERLTLGLNYTPTVVVNGRIFRENKPDLFSLVGIHEFGGFASCPPWVIDPDRSYTAILDTSAGEIEIELYADVAPIAVNSFVFLAQNGWFDEVYFHRVLPGFVAQAGDPSGLGVVGPGYKFVNETDNDLSFDRPGILGMANAGVDTNGSQFFITLAPVTNLDGGYTIFGEVAQGSLEMLDKIALRDPQTAVGFDDATIINGIEIVEK
ncbi:MAG: peptidylprolyl isomerase [Brevefilum sp.]|nr:peptidylprolyl isomerase [Brevefilum sp.]